MKDDEKPDKINTDLAPSYGHAILELKKKVSWMIKSSIER